MMKKKERRKKVKIKSDGFYGHIFVNRRNETLLCAGRVRFLRLVNRFGSIKEAAEDYNISYRKAWNMVEKTNFAAGIPVIRTIKGGKKGGASYLTPAGEKILDLFMEFEVRHRKLMKDFTIEFEKRFSKIVKKDVPRLPE
ncbi:MAG: hypothetical protein J7M18_08210 [Candidatus Eremiobacteraeota bacterium]|nr:hypothetical protein [Candidatus Eremiobacteraeota bacterium]